MSSFFEVHASHRLIEHKLGFHRQRSGQARRLSHKAAGPFGRIPEFSGK
jgi:hypothetical protein